MGQHTKGGQSTRGSAGRGAHPMGKNTGSGSYQLPSNMVTSRSKQTTSSAMHSASVPQTSNKRHALRIVAVVCSLVIVAAIVVGALNVFGIIGKNAVKVEPGQSVSVTVEEGASTKSIASTLYSAGVIDDETKYIQYVKDEGYENSLKPGTYDMTTGMDYGSVTNLLLAGPAMSGTALTIPEGLTIEKTAAVVEKTCGIPASDYIALAKTGAPTYAADYPFLEGAYGDSLEGYLFPKTYDVPEGATADTIIRMQLDQFQKETAGLDMTYAEGQGLTFSQVITMASLIEEEAMVDSDRPKIASVIYNRLSLPMRLQMDSTVIYAMGDAATGQQLTTEDTQIDSPYNTYTNDGLPPGPICSPGMASIKAAAAPDQTEYLYYVLTSKDGTQTFCTTYDEFLAAKEQYKEVFGVS